MKITLKIALLFFLISAAACSSDSLPQNEPDQNQITSELSEPELGNADVLYVIAEQQDNQTWKFTVTVNHPDTGWEDYADGWDLVLPDGTVLKINPSDQFTRLLTHPHVDEQPFTRSQSGIVIPENVRTVIVRAHDLKDGYGGKTVVVNLATPSGENFEVIGVNLTTPNSLGLTNHNLDGNRYITGQIDLVNANEIDIPLRSTPIWVVGLPQPNGSSFWFTAFEDGSSQMVLVDQEGYSEYSTLDHTLPPGAPPALRSTNSEPVVLNTLGDNISRITNPIYTSDNRLVYITDQGDLDIQSTKSSISLPINALPDGRILSDSQGNLLLLTDPTTQYQHAVLGDGIEAQSITFVPYPGESTTILTIPVPEGQVIEGIAPIWVDLNSDGEREIVVTLSDSQNGAQLVVFSEVGEIIALSSSIGTGYRWRHQIAAAPFGPHGEMEIVDVLTPHLGGVVEFFQIEGNQLITTAQIGGFTSHIIGSRNLDMALAADVDADGQVELLLPSQQLNALGAIKRTTDGAEITFEIPLNDYLSTNIASVNFGDGTIAIAVGLDIGTLKIWFP
jgi:hypothetical protein